MLAVGMLTPFTLGKTSGGWLMVSAKILLVPILAVGTYLLLLSKRRASWVWKVRTSRVLSIG